MSQTARVTSIEAIREFRGSLCRFGEDVRGALGAVEMEIHRTLDWIQHDRPLFWQSEIKRRKERLSLAQAELFRRKIQGGAGREVHDTEQKELVRVAKRALDEAEAKLEVVRKWGPVLQQAVFEYQSRARPTGDMLDQDLRSALALLDRMTAALDAYIAMAPPSTTPREPVGGGGQAGRSTSTDSTTSAITPRDEAEPAPDAESDGEGSTPPGPTPDD